MMILAFFYTVFSELVLNKYLLNDCMQKGEELTEGPVIWEPGSEKYIWTGEMKWSRRQSLDRWRLAEKPGKVSSFDNGIRHSDNFKLEEASFYSGLGQSQENRNDWFPEWKSNLQHRITFYIHHGCY